MPANKAIQWIENQLKDDKRGGVGGAGGGAGGGAEGGAGERAGDGAGGEAAVGKAAEG